MEVLVELTKMTIFCGFDRTTKIDITPVKKFFQTQPGTNSTYDDDTFLKVQKIEVPKGIKVHKELL